MLKKLIFFLLACNEQHSLLFLRRFGYKQKEGKSFSSFFLKKIKIRYKASKSMQDEQRDIFLYWRIYCQKHPIEEAMILILCSILKTPENKAAWLLKIPPKLVAFRLKQSLQNLGEEIEQCTKTKFSRTEDYKIKALDYCQQLAEQSLPEQLKASQINGRVFFSIKWFLLISGILLIGLTIFFFYKKDKTVILYQSLLIQKLTVKV